ncbi:LCP family protein [Alkalibacterium sp. f15]|uniref:LCP family protein n=1 Tax=Alkalibacterium sp. f15 TaxID=3414029 RepID=UPI003BF89A6D
MRSDKHIDKQQRVKRLKRLSLILGIIFFLTFGIIAGYFANEVREFLDDVNKDTPEELKDTSEQDASLKDLQPISFLLLGLDAEGEGGATRTDSIMIATVNPKKESTKIISIPRDTLITLPNSNEQEKFNAIYPINGIAGLIDFVEDYLTIPISFYATLNFEGLVDLVDAVGGITVDSPLSFTVQDSDETADAIVIEEGIQEVNGEEALGFARMRKQDPRGDFGRQDRQRKVIEAVIDELLSFNSVTNLTPILNAVRPNLQTNMSGQQILTVASNYTDAAKSIESVELSGAAEYVYFPSYGHDLYVWNPYEESLDEARRTLREHLELDPSSEELPEENGDDEIDN